MRKTKLLAISALCFLAAGAVLVSSVQASPPDAPNCKIEKIATVAPPAMPDATFTVYNPDTSGATVFMAADLWPEWAKRWFGFDVAMRPEIQLSPGRYMHGKPLLDQLYRYDKKGGIAGPRLLHRPATQFRNLIV